MQVILSNLVYMEPILPQKTRDKYLIIYLNNQILQMNNRVGWLRTVSTPVRERAGRLVVPYYHVSLYFKLFAQQRNTCCALISDLVLSNCFFFQYSLFFELSTFFPFHPNWQLSHTSLKKICLMRRKISFWSRTNTILKTQFFCIGQNGLILVLVCKV